MTLIELQRALRQLRCSGIATGLEGRLLQAQAEKLAPIDFLSTLVQDELLKRQDRAQRLMGSSCFDGSSSMTSGCRCRCEVARRLETMSRYTRST